MSLLDYAYEAAPTVLGGEAEGEGQDEGQGEGQGQGEGSAEENAYYFSEAGLQGSF